MLIPNGVHNFEKCGIGNKRCSMWVITTPEKAQSEVKRLAKWAKHHRYEAAFVFCAQDGNDLQNKNPFLRARWAKNADIRNRNGIWGAEVKWYDTNTEYVIEPNYNVIRQMTGQ